ncbi:hypothetical protein F1737_04520 [Methanoplanus sp. FWC-SCC4]|uniref:Uncharacterized protein n=1 Tax=Methanochimaera problematica TaxID=2609417 RepID=A0AA97I2W1_9EURY|nr:hypothetical protein F1737_04520 [Methanoplanus sp. FWC-SCC4]
MEKGTKKSPPDATIIYFWPFPDIITRKYMEKSADRITLIKNLKIKKRQFKTPWFLSGQTAKRVFI